MAPVQKSELSNKMIEAVLAIAVICIMGGTYYQAQVNTKEIVDLKVCVARLTTMQELQVKILEKLGG